MMTTLQQPRDFDAILGGNSNQPQSRDVVLGGKQAVEKAIEMLNFPEHYEQAKKVLLAQPKTSSCLPLPKSWKDKNKLYPSYILEVVKVAGLTEYIFDTPSTKTNYVRFWDNGDWEIAQMEKEILGFKNMKLVCAEFSKAFNFARRINTCEISSIDNYWDSTNRKMILLP